MDMESDRIRDLSFDPKIIESERGVVASERRLSVENSNSGALEEQLDAAAYTAHPYGWPVIGWASDIESWTMDDLKSHFRMGYAPNNCVVVVAGDVIAGRRCSRWRRSTWSRSPGRSRLRRVRTKEPEQQGERRVVLRKAAQLPLQMFSFHVPAYQPCRLRRPGGAWGGSHGGPQFAPVSPPGGSRSARLAGQPEHGLLARPRPDGLPYAAQERRRSGQDRAGALRGTGAGPRRPRSPPKSCRKPRTSCSRTSTGV